MSGHSKWSTIKHKKAVLDARRGKAWSKLVRNVTMAAKQGGGDPDLNPRLRLAVEKAKDGNVPRDTIEKAIKKGTGELEGEALEEVVYEGYGPGGVAIMCKAVTDNRTRTAPEIKKIFERSGGNLGTPNCVGWMFAQKGVLVVPADKVGEDRLMELALEAGADDVTSDGENFEVTCAPDAFLAVKKALDDAQIPLASADVTMVPSSLIPLDAETARKALRLVDALDEHDDVQTVSSNLDIPEEVMAELGKE